MGPCRRAYPALAIFLLLPFVIQRPETANLEQSLLARRNQNLVQAVVDEINLLRKEKGFPPVKVEKRLLRIAASSSELRRREGSSATSAPGQVRSKSSYNQFRQYPTITFVTDDPRIWPEDIILKVVEPHIRRVGIGVTSGIDPQTRRVAFWISMIFRDRD